MCLVNELLLTVELSVEILRWCQSTYIVCILPCGSISKKLEWVAMFALHYFNVVLLVSTVIKTVSQDALVQNQIAPPPASWVSPACWHSSRAESLSVYRAVASAVTGCALTRPRYVECINVGNNGSMHWALSTWRCIENGEEVERKMMDASHSHPFWQGEGPPVCFPKLWKWWLKEKSVCRRYGRAASELCGATLHETGG